MIVQKNVYQIEHIRKQTSYLFLCISFFKSLQKYPKNICILSHLQERKTVRHRKSSLIVQVTFENLFITLLQYCDFKRYFIITVFNNIFFQHYFFFQKAILWRQSRNFLTQ